jgi:hypothetical protein
MIHLFPSPSVKKPYSLACPLPEEKHWSYAVPSQELFPQYPWPKSLCYAAEICPIADNDLSNLEAAEKCPLAAVSGCPLFLVCADTFESFDELKDLEVFEVGGDEVPDFTEDDLDKIVENFYSLQSELHVPFVLGHQDDAEILKKSGLPAAGWASELKRKGKKLLVSALEVPTKLVDVIKKGAYKFPSVEIYKDYVKDGKSLGPVLRRIAILGADIPRIKTLQDISALYTASEATEPTWISKSSIISENSEQDKQKPTGGNSMDPKELEELKAQVQKELEEQMKLQAESFDETRAKEITALEEKISGLTTQLDELKAKAVTDESEVKAQEAVREAKMTDLQSKVDDLVAKNAALEQSLSQQKTDAHLKEVSAFCENLKTKGLAPAIVDDGNDSIRSYLLALDWQKPVVFAEGEAEKTHFVKFSELLTRMVTRQGESKLFVPLGILPKENDEKAPVGIDEDGLKLDKRIRAFAEEHSVSYEVAYEKITQADASA